MENNETNQVTIVDVKMPFLSMVIFMVKAAIAAIPALIILAIYWDYNHCSFWWHSGRHSTLAIYNVDIDIIQRG